MKNVSKVRLSLRKLLIAAMAVGPLAVLPGPVWAVLPTSSSFTVGNTGGTATVNNVGTFANINVSDRAVLVWNDNAFNIEAGDTWNFNILAATGGAVLNKVGYTTLGTLAAQDDAIISGTLQSNGRVFVLANGNIIVNTGAVISTTGGLVLSTLQDSENAFLSTGNLLGTGAALGNITLSNPLSVTGGLEAHTGTFTAGEVGGGSVSGNLVLRSVTANSGIQLATGSNLVISGNGNLTVTTNNGAITQLGGNAVVVPSNRTATFNTGGNAAITLNASANNFGTVALTSGGNVTLNDTNELALGASTVGGDLVVTAGGNLTSSGTVAVTGNASFTTTTGGNVVNIGNNSSVGGNLVAATNAGAFTFNGTGNVTAGTLNVGTGAISITSNGTIRFNDVITSTGNITATGATINQTSAATITNAGVVTFNGTSGNVALGPITANRVSITSNNGTISQSGALVTTAVSGTNTFNAGSAGNIVLTNGSNNLYTGTTLNVTSSTANIVTGNSVLVGTSNITGGNFTINTAVSGGNVVLGGTAVGTSAGNISVAGVLNVVTLDAGAITDNPYSTFNVLGGLNLTSGTGNITLTAATQNAGLAPVVSFGTVAATTGGNVTIHETSTLNLGNITAGNLSARSATGGIIDSGNLTVSTGTANFTAASGASVTLDSGNNQIGTVNFIGGTDHSYLGNSTVTLGNATAVAGNLTVATKGSSNNIVLSGPQVTGLLVVDSSGSINVGANTTVTGDLTLMADNTTGTSITQSAGTALKVTGNTSITSGGNVTLGSLVFAEANDFNNVVFNGTGGDAQISDINNLMVSGNVAGNLTAVAGNDMSVVNAYSLTLGNLVVGGLNASAENGVDLAASGPSGAVTQAADTRISSFGNVSFSTINAPITINNAGNSFGGVSAAAGSGTINITEDAFLRILNVASTGNVSLTSRFGSIVETAAGANTLSGNVVTLNAPNGSINVGGTTLTTGTIAGAANTIIANAPNGAVAVQSTTANLALGEINALTLAVSHTGTGNLTQSGRANIFGTSNVTSAGNISLSNTANNFGRVNLTTSGGGKSITIVEAPTLNLGSVSMPGGTSGNFTATSLGGDIIDSGLIGVKIGGNQTTTMGVTTLNLGTGVVTLNATAGNIVLDDPTTDFLTTGGVVFNGNNVVLSPLNSIVLGASNTTSNATTLNVTSLTGTITDKGNIVVTGDATFQTGAQNIVLDSTGNRFGSVRFAGNQVTITQANDMNIITGSTAIGAAAFTSGSYITIDNRGDGTVTLGSTALFDAQGSIVLPKLIQIADTLTVRSPNLKDLSALSIAGDLAGKTPQDLGTGTYLPPQP